MDTYSAHDLAHIWYEKTLRKGVGRLAGQEIVIDGDGQAYLNDSPRSGEWTTRLETAAYWDLDFEEGFLLRVITCRRDEGEHIEVVDYLACRSVTDQRPGRRIDVEWFNHPHLFFDNDWDHHCHAQRWFAGWMHSEVERAWDERGRSRQPWEPSDLALRDREIARRLGIRFEIPEAEVSVARRG